MQRIQKSKCSGDIFENPCIVTVFIAKNNIYSFTMLYKRLSTKIYMHFGPPEEKAFRIIRNALHTYSNNLLSRSH